MFIGHFSRCIGLILTILVMQCSAATQIVFQDAGLAAIPDSLTLAEIVGNRFLDPNASRQGNNEFTLPVRFFRIIPVNPDSQNVYISHADMLDVIDNTMVFCEESYEPSGLGFSFAGYSELYVDWTVASERQSNCDSVLTRYVNPYQGNNICVAIMPLQYIIGGNRDNCGNASFPLRWSERCLVRGQEDILAHELGHKLTLNHTFGGNSSIQDDVFKVLRPDSTYASFLTDCPGELVDRSNCAYTADRHCDTPSEINSCCDQIKNNDAEWWVYDTVEDTLRAGGTIYVPDFNSPLIISHPWWGRQIFYDMYMSPADPCTRVTSILDCNDSLMVRPYEDLGTYNIMSYAPFGCPAEFSPNQLDKVNYTLNTAPQYYPLVQNIVNNIIVNDYGDIDSDPLTFSSISNALSFISSDYHQLYRVFITSEYFGLEDREILLTNSGLDSLVSNFDGRPIFVDILGVSSISGTGQNLVWEPAAQGEIVVHQDHLNETAPIRVHGRVDLTVQNIQFENFGNGRMFAASSGVPLASTLDFQGSHLELRNCTFVGNGLNSTRMTSLDVCEGVVHFNPLQEPSLLIQNCVFADNRSPAGPAVALGMDNVGDAPEGAISIIQSTFANNFFLQNTPQNGVMHVETMGSVLLRNCVFSGSDPLHGTPGNQPAIAVEIGDPRAMSAVIENCLFDQEQWVEDGLPGLEPSNAVIHHDSTPGFTNPTLQDYRLKWDSVCMDVGSSLEPMNFDLTQSDIGWSPVYPVTDITGNQTGSMELGWYRVLNNAILSAEDLIIPAGTVLRFDSGVYASFRAQGAFSGGYNITIGDLNGPRTALVAKDTYGSQELPCGHYGFGTSATAPYLTNVDFKGVLFNYAPSMGMGFSRSNVNLDGENIVAMEFENVGLAFSTCDGQVTHFSETTGCGPRLGWVDQMSSAVDVSYVDFPPQEDAFFCNLFNSGTYAGQTILQHNNEVRGNPVQSGYDNIPVLLFDCTVRQHHNQYDNLAAGGVYMADATLHMNNGAENRFTRIQDYAPLTALVQGYDAAAYINVECGYNTFVDPDVTIYNRDFVEGGCASTDWNLNFWGTDCNTPVSPQNRIPNCATAVNNLSVCPTQVIPCPDQIVDSELYAIGVEANQIGNHEAAVAYWTELLVEFPDSKYASSVTGWVKSLGITTLYGEDEYSYIVTRLVDAAQAADGIEPHLSVYEFASAQCVEARHGDRVGAIASLDSMKLVLSDPDDIKTIIYARLEVDTYPSQGQMNAMAPGDWVQAEQNQRQAVRRLQAAMAPSKLPTIDEEVVPGTIVPSSFQLERPVPNPFNPRTHLALQLPAEGDVLVRVYNVQGQVVTTLREGWMRAGRHELVVDAGSWASGVYLAQARFQGQVQTQKLVLVK